ncbi:MAG: selenium cofactor biosynthesis protein YqeC [Tractidigestivibacter sp.]|jgi:probable selenium-dependent hydroxylase accessory protein YqeC|uniref:selenium cofactor biosynthesis protein YqeC n=1 Tax=Tractidigestivibacter sp. TaxID=2847320 RepID=UPI003D8B30AD
MKIIDLLPTERGTVSVVGSGGKTTLLHQLAKNLGDTVVLATTTHMLVPEHCPLLTEATELDVEQALWYSRVICVGEMVDVNGTQKLAAPKLHFPTLEALSDWVIVEADGSKRLPLKAHADFEPVIPDGSKRTILVVGASGFGQPVEQVVHRHEIFSQLTECEADEPCTPELYARGVAAEAAAGRIAPDVIAINQAESPDALAASARFASALREQGIDVPIAAGSFRMNDLREL